MGDIIIVLIYSALSQIQYIEAFDDGAYFWTAGHYCWPVQVRHFLLQQPLAGADR